MIVFTDNAPAVAPLDPQPMLAWLRREAVILQARGTAFGEQAYLCTRGRRHPLVSAARLEEFGFRWPADVQQVSERVLASYAPAGGIPAPRRGPTDFDALNDAMEVREAIASSLDGFGLEIGAGASPFPVPPRCRLAFWRAPCKTCWHAPENTCVVNSCERIRNASSGRRWATRS